MDDSVLGEKLQEQLRFINSYLRKMGASKEDAEDIVQDTAYKFLLYIDSIETKKAESWLFRVAVNHYYDTYRQKTRRQDILLKFNFQRLFEEYTPEKAIVEKERTADIEHLLGRLKAKHREFLLLKYSVGLRISEIAELYQMKENSAKTILHRARRQFIKEYRRFEDEG